MTIIVQLILDLLPVLAQWLIDLLNKHAADQTASGDDAADAETLLLCVLRDLPPLAVAKRAFVRVLLAYVPPAIRAGEKELPDDVNTELTAAQAIIDKLG